LFIGAPLPVVLRRYAFHAGHSGSSSLINLTLGQQVDDRMSHGYAKFKSVHAQRDKAVLKRIALVDGWCMADGDTPARIALLNKDKTSLSSSS
jgi:hypothetical protein